MRINHMQHVAVNTVDINRSIRFYEEVMGLKKMTDADMGECTLVYMRVDDNSCIELFDLRGACEKGAVPEARQGLRHIAFDVDSVAEWSAFLKEKEVPFVMEITEMPPIGKRAILIKDPDGTVIELCEDLT